MPEDLRDRPAPKRARPPRKGSKAAAAAEAAADDTASEITAPMPLSPDVIADADAALPQSDTPEPVAEAAPVKKATRSRKKKTDDVAVEAEAVAEPVAVAPEPVAAEPAPAPVKVLEPAIAEPDPHEIAAPPEKPKRGWWRK